MSYSSRKFAEIALFSRCSFPAERFFEKFSKFQDCYRKEDLDKLRIIKKKGHMQANNEALNVFR